LNSHNLDYDAMAVQPASLEVLEKAAVPPAQARAIVRAFEIEIAMADLRHGFELRLASTVTQPQLYAALLGQMALLLGIAYFFVTHLQH